MNLELNQIKSPNGLTIYHTGPPLDSGPLPSLFYFALSGQQSLQLDPFNQPVAHLTNKPIRCFSFTLPFHGEDYDQKKAMKLWAKEITAENNFLEEFLIKSCENIQFLIDQQLVLPSKLTVAGLSRGGFIATHLAMRDPRISQIVGYAPLTTLKFLGEFTNLAENPIIQSLHLNPEQLIDRHLRFYIGNRDTRVSSDDCYQFVREVTEAAYSTGIRSPQTELILFPSIGHKGHGTPKHIFEHGAEFILKRMNQ